MSISERYRQLVDEVRTLQSQLQQDAPEEQALTVLHKAVATLADQHERVGEIPRARIDAELSPVLLTAHNLFDRSRLLLEKDDQAPAAERVWEVQRKIYRLLNDL
jgi:hypothetical protein